MFMPMRMTMMMMILSMTFSGHCHDYAFRNRYRCHGLLPHLVNICTRALADGHTVVAALLERPHLWPLLDGGGLVQRRAVQVLWMLEEAAADPPGLLRPRLLHRWLVAVPDVAAEAREAQRKAAQVATAQTPGAESAVTPVATAQFLLRAALGTDLMLEGARARLAKGCACLPGRQCEGRDAQPAGRTASPGGPGEDRRVREHSPGEGVAGRRDRGEVTGAPADLLVKGVLQRRIGGVVVAAPAKSVALFPHQWDLEPWR